MQDYPTRVCVNTQVTRGYTEDLRATVVPVGHGNVPANVFTCELVVRKVEPPKLRKLAQLLWDSAL